MTRNLRMEGVAFAYDDRARIFSDLNLEVASGVTLLSGENGAGKTTLLKLAAGVEKPDAGRVLVNGSDLWRREVAARSDLAFVPQEPDVTPFATIREVLRLVCRLRSQPAEQVDQVLSETDLEDSADLSIRELSRGQRRRVLLAAAWIGTPRTAILDEPLDAMDEHWRSRIHGWLKALRETGGLALVATHEAGSLTELADRFLVLRDGEIRELDSLPQDTTGRSHEEPA